MKGTVYGGMIHMPTHPDADMHGLVRAVVRTKFFGDVIHALERFGVRLIPQDLGRTWHVSQSVMEHEVTHNRYGEVIACPPAMAYLKPDFYKPIPKSFMVGKRKEGGPNELSSIGPKREPAGTPRPGRDGAVTGAGKAEKT